MRDRLYLPLGIIAIGATRAAFRSHLLYDIDSVNFALGLDRFDPAAHQPHPPGYFLYICLGRLIRLACPDANTALVAISIGAGCAAAAVIYWLTRDWYGESAARISLLLFLISPLCWFHGIVALTYIVEAFFSALIGFLCWRAYRGRPGPAVMASLVLALAAGFRPSTALMLGPLWLVTLWRVPRGIRWLSLAAALAVSSAWFLMMASAAGGIAHYLASFTRLWTMVPGQRTILASGWLAVARFLAIGWNFPVCFGVAAGLAFWQAGKGPPADLDRTRFQRIWIVPGVLFFGLVFFNYINSGYLLVLAPPFFAWLAARAHSFLKAVPHRRLRWAILGAAAAVNTALFLFAPLYWSHRSVRDFESGLAAVTRDFHNHLDPSDTLIIGFDSHFRGYRHPGYYLPEFVTVQYPEIRYSDGPHVFLMHGRDTEVVRSFSTARYRRFVLYPLPEGPNYAQYLESVLARLPREQLATERIGDQQVVTGPASAIPLLFPVTAR